MRLLINQKYFSFRNRFTINYENGQPAYDVEGKLISLHRKFYVLEPNGREIFMVRQRLFHLFPHLDIMQNDNVIARFISKFSIFVKRAVIKSEVFGDLKIKGSVLAWSFDILDANGNQVAEISKKILKIRDTYTVDIFDSRYQDIIAAIAVIIDSLYHKKH